MTPDPVGEILEPAIRTATGERFVLLARAPVSGGCIHEAMRLDGRVADATPSGL